MAKATGASIVLSLADAEASETFEASSLGTADEVRQLLATSTALLLLLTNYGTILVSTDECTAAGAAWSSCLLVMTLEGFIPISLEADFEPW